MKELKLSCESLRGEPGITVPIRIGLQTKVEVQPVGECAVYDALVSTSRMITSQRLVCLFNSHVD
jgi:hypothetical protein